MEARIRFLEKEIESLRKEVMCEKSGTNCNSS